MKDNQFILKDYIKSSDFVKSPFRYPGGKFYALKYIIPYLDCVPHDEYREPFVGGGSVFFAKNKVAFNWINDLESDIIDVYKAFSDIDNLNRFEMLLKNEQANPARFNEMKAFAPNNFFEKVYRTFYLNRTSYCGIINKPAWGYKEKKSSPPQNWANFIKDIFPKLLNVEITDRDFSEVITSPKKGERVLLYLDPPYFKADQKRAYTKPFQKSDHIRLAELLKDTNYYFCLSYDDVDEIRAMYSWANIYETQWLYNTANKKGTSREMGNELIITNYEIARLSLFEH